MNNIVNLIRNQLKDRETCLEWLRDIELIPRSKKCHKCKRDMTFRKHHGIGQFRCRGKHGQKGDIEVSAAKGTWFENAHIEPEKVILLTYAFALDMPIKNAIRETSIDSVTSSETVCDWFSYCREVCQLALDKNYEEEGKIGGVGHTVEIDETKVGKMKYNRGRYREGHWVLGMIDRQGGYRLEICPDNKRDTETLIPLIEKHVEKGTKIVTDEWRPYNRLSEIGYTHETVNHSEHFKDPVTGAHTNTIEGSWKHLKHYLTRSGFSEDQMDKHMCAYLWRRECRLKDLDPFDQILNFNL